MPKFELDPRTGMMVQKKDDQIYFAGSMGGGLRIDDKKNNVTYIVERDERITNIAGIRNSQVNLYDLRDARIIADRVLRKFGRDHKYSDYHYFLRGYKVSESIVKTCSDFLDESIFNAGAERNQSGEVKKEIGRYIGDFSDGTRIIAPNECFGEGELVNFDDKPYYHFEDLDLDVVCFTDGDLDTFYRCDDSVDEGQPNLMKCFESVDTLRYDDFDVLLAVIKSDGWGSSSDLDDLDVDYRNRSVRFTSGNMSFLVFWDEDEATEYAIDLEKDLLDGCLDKESIKRFHFLFGDDIVDMKGVKTAMRESYEAYYDDLDEEDAIQELINLKIIEETEEYFEVDEDGDVDLTLPKFNYQDYQDDYVDTMMDSLDDVVEEMISQYGESELENYIDIDKLAKCIIDTDGRGATLASYDSTEREEVINGKTYYVYRED